MYSTKFYYSERFEEFFAGIIETAIKVENVSNFRVVLNGVEKTEGKSLSSNSTASFQGTFNVGDILEVIATSEPENPPNVEIEGGLVSDKNVDSLNHHIAFLRLNILDRSIEPEFDLTLTDDELEKYREFIG